MKITILALLLAYLVIGVKGFKVNDVFDSERQDFEKLYKEIEDEINDLTDEKEGQNDEIIISNPQNGVHRRFHRLTYGTQRVRRASCYPGQLYRDCKWKFIEMELKYVCQWKSRIICS